FRKYYPNVQIQVPSPFAGSVGAQELVQSKLDFVFVSRELRPDDIKDFKAIFGYPPLSVPVSGGSYRHYGFLDTVSFIVNKQNPIETLSFAQLDGIFSTTHYRGASALTTWGQLGLTGEWADKPIHLYGIKPWNGYEEFIRQRVLSTPGQRGEWRDDITFDKVVFPIAGRIAVDRYGIGYTGVAYVDSAVKMLAVSGDEAGPYYSATYENVARAAYPLTRLIYFNTNKSPDKPLNLALQEFLRFILSREGQQIILDQGIFIPLRAGQASGSRSLLE
ncbi:MAG: substrate-binding domain-containing protein, partial [Acidobacteriaceae bacterium]|nr:substrate-binding domain-containing protein [Acidobacteriaceae bacterium]